MGIATIGEENLVKSRDGRYVCVVDGNISNYKDVGANLQQEDHAVICSTATETVLSCFLRKGPLSSKLFKGGFVAAILDTHRKELTLIRDSFGLKVIYYANTSEGFLFSSNLTGLVKGTSFDKKIGLSGFTEYMACGYISAPRTIYEHVSCLRPGEYLVFKNNTISIDCFSNYEIPNWRFHDVSRFSFKEMMDKYYELLVSSVESRIPTDKDIAVYLSGGLDTPLLCSALKDSTSKNIISYTLGFQNSRYDEVPYARDYAKHLNIEHRSSYLRKEDFLETFSLLPDIYGQPFADISAIPTHVISSKVSKDFDLVFLGDGPDFLLGTYDMRLFYYYYKFVPLFLRGIIAESVLFLTKIIFKKYMTPNVDAPELVRQPNFFWTFTRMFKSYDLEKLMGKSMPPETFWIQNFIENRRDIPIAERLRLAQYLGYGVNSALYKSCCAHDVNAIGFQCPFYDEELVNFIQYLPTKYKFNYFYGKHLQKKLLYEKFPPKLLNRPKRGFIFDFKDFGLEMLKSLTDKYLTTERLSETGLMNAEFALRCVEEYFKGNTSLGPKIWTLLIFELWRDKFSA